MSEQRFKPSNELTFGTVQNDIARLHKLFTTGTISNLSFELHNVNYCDSAGLALLIETKRLCKQHNVRLEINGVPKSISALAEFCGVEGMLESTA